ncbi:hypothetical protein [Planctomyces sp. SH-PL14]|uniref:hypothetical protein n=1 Tax=Planctomyces sp. SH-PL14 TaxID=1632864 RepID=UPI00078ED02C|nr:hypothetical protein [Planctomyces sp. SH-PL14]AMV19093.1 hypothetical protein VT03_14475 [Planctomyces sp. SH-PL14]
MHGIRLALAWSLFAATLPVAFAAEDWHPFQPPPDALVDSPIGLRSLNERFAGEHGRIAARDGRFVHGDTGSPVRFWAVNGPPDDLTGDDLRRCARMLADYGVNLVRVHRPLFDARGEVDPAKVRQAQEIVAALKAEGIYTHFSIYFPLWFKPKADLAWLPGYDGQKPPFAALQFNREFQKRHQEWLRALLTTPDARTGKTLLDEPAVFGVEVQNEDSFFFWTFDARNIPAPQLQILETRFGDWLTKRYGSIAKALETWKGQALPRDAEKEGRVGFRPLWNIAHEKTRRDQDTATFLLEVQTEFYRDTYQFLRQLGFQGLIHCSNWATADPAVLGPLEKLSYTAGDFVDRHGYFECNHKGDNAAWSIRPGHTYSDRSALRFDPPVPGKPRTIGHPVMDPHYDDKPSMISETTFTRPNRYRSEAPLYFAAYGALQDSDGIVHFAFDGANWNVKPRFWMQQWTLATPAMLGQFPAAALLYRKGLIQEGDMVADISLNRDDLLHLKGTPLPQDAAFDELRLADVPSGVDIKPGQRLDPLLHFAGRTRVRFVDGPGGFLGCDSASLIDHKGQTVTSTTRELKLDYGRGLLTINAPQAAGLSGNLKSAGATKLGAFEIASDLDLGHILAVSLDDQPLSTSKKILVQAMSEERATGFRTEPAEEGTYKITDIGRDPWQVRSLSGTVRFHRPDAATLRVTPLDISGRPQRKGAALKANAISLLPDTIYYLIEK